MFFLRGKKCNVCYIKYIDISRRNADRISPCEHEHVACCCCCPPLKLNINWMVVPTIFYLQEHNNDISLLLVSIRLYEWKNTI